MSMENVLAIANQAQQLRDFGQMLVSSGLLPQSIRTAEQAVVIVLKGNELGLPPMEALSSIVVIQGKPTVAPQLMLALIERSGQLQDMSCEVKPDAATCTMQRRGRSPVVRTFGAKEAQAMGLSGKDNYKKQPGVMYQWRAIAACARVAFPDVISGLYTPDEMGADVSITDDGAQVVAAPMLTMAAPTVVAPAPLPPAKPERTLEQKHAAADAKIEELGDELLMFGPDELDRFNSYADQELEDKAMLVRAMQARLEELRAMPPVELASKQQVTTIRLLCQEMEFKNDGERRAFVSWYFGISPALSTTKDLTKSQAGTFIDQFGIKGDNGHWYINPTVAEVQFARFMNWQAAQQEGAAA
jgi:hypothetical protein